MLAHARPGKRQAIVPGHRRHVVVPRPRERVLRRLGEADQRPCAHELVVARNHPAPFGMLRRLVAGIGDPRFRDRVGKEEFRHRLPEAIGALHPAKHAFHAVRIQIRPDHGVDADAVCFLFAAAAVSKLVLQHGCLRARHRRQTSVNVAARGHEHRTGKQAHEHGQCRLPLRLDIPREVALTKMREFVRHHGGIFMHVAGMEQQPQVHAHHPAGHGKRVDRGVVDQHRIEGRVLQVRMLRELPQLRGDVVLEYLVVDRGNLRPHLFQEHLAEPALLRGRDDRRGRIAELRQLVRRRSMRRRKTSQPDGERQQREDSHGRDRIRTEVWRCKPQGSEMHRERRQVAPCNPIYSWSASCDHVQTR